MIILTGPQTHRCELLLKPAAGWMSESSRVIP